jgi:hypothetical protein
MTQHLDVDNTPGPNIQDLFISRLDWSSIKRPCVMMLVGPKLCGKTTFINNFCRETLEEDPEHRFAIFGPDLLPTSAILDEITRTRPDQKNNVTIILDGIPSDTLNDIRKVLARLALNSRHYRVTIIITSQYGLSLGPEFRCNVDYTFLWPTTNMSLLKSMYDQYYSLAPLPNFSAFIMAVRTVKQYEMLVADNVRQTGLWYKTLNPGPANFTVPEESRLRLQPTRPVAEAQAEQLKSKLVSMLHTLQAWQDEIKALL